MQNLDLKNKTVFITGVAGFIGSNLAERLLKEIEGIKIVGLDNMNDYYDVRLKEYRLEKLSSSEAFSFVKGNLADKEVVNSIFEKYKPELVVNLGAQAGVRYSITNPDSLDEFNGHSISVFTYLIVQALNGHLSFFWIYQKSFSDQSR